MGGVNRKIIINASISLLLFSIALVVILLYEFGVIPTHKSGFYCNDPALSMPYITNETIPNELLICVTILVPLIFIAVNEYINFYNASSPWDMRKAANTTFYLYREFIVGIGLNILLVEIMKITIGKPRPSFFEVCKPVADCSIPNAYVDKYECNNPDVDYHTILDINRSFPSGHASASVNLAIFMFLYIKQRCKVSWMVGLFCQLLCLAWGGVTPLSRVIDYRHHWWDVLAGTIIGIIFALYSVYQVCKNFNMEIKSESKNFTLVVDKMISRRFNHTLDNNNIDHSNVHPV